MNYRDYINAVRRTESNNFSKIASRLGDEEFIRLMHAAIGICTEAAELLDAVKKSAFYGKKIDQANIVEELGDLFWYMALASDVLKVPFSKIIDKNILKLKTRYPDAFTEHLARYRNLDKEREQLEGNNE